MAGLTFEQRRAIREARSDDARRRCRSVAAIERAEKGLKRVTQESEAQRKRTPPVRLSPLERDVLEGAGNGETIRATAERRGCEEPTVKEARQRLRRKLDARNVAEAFAIAYRLGLVE